MSRKPAQEHQDQLKSIKKRIESASIYFKPNYERYHKFQKFVFQTALDSQDIDTLTSMGKPIIEFNICNAPISRLCGEFSKQEPSIYVTAENGAEVDPEVIRVVEGHIRHILFESKKHNIQYNVYRDQLSGGFSDFKVWTDYANEMSFDQVINFGRTYDPTLTGFDPMAREVDKSDAEYCFEIFPMPKEDFKREYPDIDVEQLQYQKSAIGGFNWSYTTQNQEDVIVVCDFYQKKKKRIKIVNLADNRVLSMDDYNKFLESWTEQGIVAQPPAIVGEPRWTESCYICRYRVMETEVIEYKETSFKYLPLVFVDGDSVIIREGDSGSMQQFTKPYIYHAEGIQKLTNFSGQVIANDFENMVMHKFKVAEESLPDQKEFRDAYTTYQVPNTLVYKHLYNDDPNIQLPAPQEIARVPLPSEVVSTFNTSMQMLQNILGAYDASLGINDKQLSGVAIVEAATQSNAAAMPYIVNYMQSLNQVANIILDLIPKYYVTPRTIPIVDKEGKRSSQKINQPGGISFNYDENVLQVKVEAGVNFAIAKNKALQQIIALMQASPQFSEFMSADGLEILLDNIEFRNVDVLKAKVDEWLHKKQQQPSPEAQQAQAQAAQAQAQMQMAQQQIQIEQQKVAQKGEEIQANTMLKTEQLLVDKEKVDNERMAILQKAGESREKLEASVIRSHAEEERARADMHMQAHDQAHRQKKEAIEVALKHHVATKPEPEKKEII